MQPFWPHFHQLQNSGTPFCCVTLVDSLGSAPADRGAKMLATCEGLVAGTVGGGKIEAWALLEACEMLAKSVSEPVFVQWNLQTELGMTCGGAVKLFFEPFNIARWPIVIFGAGHVAQALVPVLLPLDCRLTCLDTRAEWLDRLPKAPQLRAELSTDLAAEVANLAPNSFVLLMTMGHATDLPVLRELLERPFPYVGVIGSKSKAGALRNTLNREGFSAEDCGRFFCPVGLPIGSNHTHEIAISIAAQLLQVRDSQR
ncbi:xanthine dehydrogenase accessory protein XdhC [bacterium]|nr:MAG: xanthine dehydrogenase accessory protein XdhC [bacterium]